MILFNRQASALVDTPITEALTKLQAYVERERFYGYDPYDVLNGWINWTRFGKWVPILALQFQKRNPINLRPLMGIKKGHNPKAMGLLLHAYALCYERDPSPKTKVQMAQLFEWLCTHYTHGYSGYCWGYNWDWATPSKFMKAYTPTIVATSFIGKGLFKYYEVTGDPKALEVFLSACNFILEDLPRTNIASGLCFSYTPLKKDCCYNASMLGAEMLARAYAVTGNEKYRATAIRAVDFVVSHQQNDGCWYYEIDLVSREEDKQVDFHQGYVLESLHACMNYASITDSWYDSALRLGARFYKEAQFFQDGRSLFRWPKEEPVDIHNQAQGIITFVKLADLDPGFLPFAHTIADWTVREMQDEAGYFYYRKHRRFTNKIPYMRWSQAWMMLALAYLLRK